MVTSWLDGEIVWLKMDGEFIADELIAETNKWLQTRPQDYLGYLVDVRNMTKQTAAEQEKAEAAAKKNRSGKVRAVLGSNEAFRIAVNIYIRFTKAEGMRYFTDVGEAKAWIMSFKQGKS